MRKKDLEVWRGKEKNEIGQEIEKRQKELVEVRAKIALGKEKNVKKIKQVKKDIAQLLTFFNKKGEN